MGLNEKLYKRFGLTSDVEKIRNGFIIYFKNTFLSDFNGFGIFRDLFSMDEKKEKELRLVEKLIVKKVCQQLFIDFTHYDYLEKLICDISTYNSSFEDPEEYFFDKILKYQILLDVVYNEKLIKLEYNKFINSIEKYINTYSELGIFIKRYKTKAPQIYPLNYSKVFEKNINSVLGILEAKKYENTLIMFESGLRKLLSAKIYKDFKDIFSDMAGSLDEFTKEFSGDNNKSFKHIFKEGEYQKFGLTKTNKEIYNQVRIYLDDVKHGKIKEIVRKDAEFIINQTAMFINYVLK